MYQPAQFKRTFYNNLRVYDTSSSNVRSKTATKTQRSDIYTRTQQHYNDKF